MSDCDHILGWDVEPYEGAEPVTVSQMAPGGIYSKGHIYEFCNPYKIIADECSGGFHPARFCSECGEKLDHTSYLDRFRPASIFPASGGLKLSPSAIKEICNAK